MTADALEIAISRSDLLGRLCAKGGMMARKYLALLIVVLLPCAAAACGSHPTAPSGAAPVAQSDGSAIAAGGRAATTMTVFVSSQGLYYDTFVARDPLPMEGKFQLLVNGTTQFGPGDPGYLGGRWWEDLNANGIQDATDHYFLCPLLPPGRPTP
jgi:hypothetical protein